MMTRLRVFRVFVLLLLASTLFTHVHAGPLGPRTVKVIPNIAYTEKTATHCHTVAGCEVTFCAELLGPWSENLSYHWHTTIFDNNAYTRCYSATAQASCVGQKDHIWVRVTDNEDGFSTTGNCWITIHGEEPEIKVTSIVDEEIGDEVLAKTPKIHCCNKEGMHVTLAVNETSTVRNSLTGGCSAAFPIKAVAAQLGVDYTRTWGSDITVGMTIDGDLEYEQYGGAVWLPIWKVTSGTYTLWECDGTKETCPFTAREYVNSVVRWKFVNLSCPP